jgi:hypothetical protein
MADISSFGGDHLRLMLREIADGELFRRRNLEVPENIERLTIVGL